MKNIWNVGKLVGTSLLITSCASQPYPNAYDPPGFFVGLWHGAISPLAFVGSIFFDIRMYAFPNSGVWYDFGFVIGLLVMLLVVIGILASD